MTSTAGADPLAAVKRPGTLRAARVDVLLARGAVYVVLLAVSALMLVPLVWTVSTSLKSPGEMFLYPPRWLPSWPLHWQNYTEGLTKLPFGLYAVNTIIITTAATIGSVLSSSLIGFAFARYRAPGSRFLFATVLATMMIPFSVTMIPTFLLFKLFGWVNTFAPLIVPSFFGGAPFYIFLMRQFLMTIPLELDDAATVDGCSPLGIYWWIILPLSRPALATVAIFAFVHNWNDFLGPLIYLTDERKYTFALGINYLKGYGGMGVLEPGPLMAVSMVSVVPVLLVFFFAQKTFIQGIVTTGIKM